MFIKKIQIKNYKCLRKNSITLGVPNGKPGSGLNFFIGDNNCGKSSIFEVIKKLEDQQLTKEEINYIARNKKEEVGVKFLSKDGKETEYESEYFVNEDPKFELNNTKTGFKFECWHINTNRMVAKKIPFGALRSSTRYGKNEEIENKRDMYQIIQEINKLSPEQKNEFCKTVNKFLPNIARVRVDLNRRDDMAQLKCKLVNEELIDLRDMGSGIEQFIILLWLLKYASYNVLLVDEPEISLHPQAQKHLSDLLIESSCEKQIIVATHSPYIFKDSIQRGSTNFIFNKKPNTVVIRNMKLKQNKLFNWSPSWGEINYFAFNLPTIEFHNELYGWIKEETLPSLRRTNNIDTFFNREGMSKDISYTEERNGGRGNTYDVTLPTLIRHTIHHPENRFNTYKLKDDDLRKSTDFMVNIVKKYQ